MIAEPWPASVLAQCDDPGCFAMAALTSTTTSEFDAWLEAIGWAISEGRYLCPAHAREAADAAQREDETDG